MYENGRQFLISAYPSTRMSGICFLTQTELGPVLLKIQKLKAILWFSGLVSLILTLLFSYIVSASIIEPIGFLTQGIARLKKRDFRHPIPLLGNDELGRLGEAFNGLFEEFKEMDLGCAVQKSLIPLEPPQIPGYELALHYTPASDLGGDFVEILRRPDGKFLLGIADVTGHGVPSAILTAMTKMAFFLSAMENQPLPNLLVRLNLLVNQALKKKRLMTLFVGILDLQTHTFEWAPVGHPYPLFRTADGQIQELGKPSRPMGSSLAMKWTIEKTVITLDSTLVFYTDGLVEANGMTGIQFGYDRLRNPLLGKEVLTANQVLESLLSDLKIHVGTTAPDDDVTILVLHRSS
ncbi:MAG: SpoIIE family protein phosphatase [Candidatus Ozemobacteraceae bacterium]